MPLSPVSIAGHLPFPVLLRSFIAWHRLTYCRRSRQVAALTHIHPLAELDLSAYKHSDTVFLLGSGPSINRISEARWRIIQQHDTWGFNFWGYHRIVPNLYFLEAINKDLTRHIYDAFIAMAHANVARYAGAPKIISELFSGNSEDFVRALPAEWQSSLYHARPVTPAARTPQEFARSLRYFRRRGVFNQKPRLNSVFKYASTISMLVSLAVNMGYTRIVLCGVDLTSQEYFYQDPALYPDYHTLIPERVDQPHLLVRDFPWLIKLHDVLNAMRAEVLAPAGIELFVEHTGSALFPNIPLVPQSLFAEQQAERPITR